MVIEGGVDRAGLDAERERDADAVDLERLDVEAAGGEIHAVGLAGLHVHAGNRGKQRVHVVELKILDLRARDDADRLRRLPECQVEPRRGRLAGNRIIAAALGPCAGDDNLISGLAGLECGFGPEIGLDDGLGIKRGRGHESGE